MYGSLVADLGIGPEVWLFLSLLGCVSLYFKFNRFWSVRNLDLLLLFALHRPDDAGRQRRQRPAGGGRVRLVVSRLAFVDRAGACSTSA